MPGASSRRTIARSLRSSRMRALRGELLIGPLRTGRRLAHSQSPSPRSGAARAARSGWPGQGLLIASRDRDVCRTAAASLHPTEVGRALVVGRDGPASVGGTGAGESRRTRRVVRRRARNGTELAAPALDEVEPRSRDRAARASSHSGRSASGGRPLPSHERAFLLPIGVPGRSTRRGTGLPGRRAMRSPRRTRRVPRSCDAFGSVCDSPTVRPAAALRPPRSSSCGPAHGAATGRTARSGRPSSGPS